MTSMLARIVVGAALATAPLAARAQDTTHASDSTRMMVQSARVLDHTFNAAVGEPVRVFLAKDVVYHVEIVGTGIQLQLRPMMQSVQRPLIQPLLDGTSAGGSTLYQVTPRADAEYEFISTGGDPARPVSLHVTAQVKKP